ncbi:MAG: hypothetical protein KIC48_12450 [Citrobacter sp.]|uniref:Integrase n=1 Tax=Citrobacter braakii TaxID=57706 RepID=A0A1V8P493_CITBR|nr:hypothetical protein [Citrobacter sp.]OQM43464.1 hypothetical protein BZK42_00775 [Citrobacter braakii]PAX77281.1 hypothetical protein CIK43_24010 [Citrobacter sp. TSA-1]QKE20893.1 hypothetical protein HF677_014960 [Citrobacter sp. TSA-1]QXC14196.1 hypothetical protein I6L51_14115 [Citrobacter braakii]
MKASQMHRVPLSKQAMAIIENMWGLHKELVFPSPRKQIVLSDMVLTAFLRRVKAKSDVPGRVATAHGFVRVFVIGAVSTDTVFYFTVGRCHS